MKEIKTFCCPYCNTPVKIRSNQEIIDHITLSKTCTCEIDFSQMNDEEILGRLIRNGLLTKTECFISQTREETAVKLKI